MEPHIDAVRFGAITVGGQIYKHDITLDFAGQIADRKKVLSKQQYGTSHILSLAEVEATWLPGVETLIVGTGFFDRVRLSPEAETFLAKHKCGVDLLPTKKAVRLWNERQGTVVAILHITC